MFGFGKKKQSVTENFDKLFVDDHLEIARSRSKIYARVSHYSSLFEGENYDVDLRAAYFKGLMNGECVSFGPLQVVGTHNGNDFLWSWHNPSIPETAWIEVKTFVQNNALLKPLAELKKFTCTPDFAEHLAQWIAVKSGWLGAFEAPYEATMTFLLLKLTCFEGHSVEPAENIWCSFCGRLNTQVAKLLAASSSCSICDLCVQDYWEIAKDSADQNSSFEFSDIESMPPCIICGDRTKRIFSTYGSVCHECIRACHDAIA